MARTYFKTISTGGHVDKRDIIIAEHDQKLNNYSSYGFDLDNSAYSKLADMFKAPTGMVREVCSQSTTSVLYNFVFTIITILHCEEETMEEQMMENNRK